MGNQDNNVKSENLHQRLLEENASNQLARDNEQQESLAEDRTASGRGRDQEKKIDG